MDDKLDTDPTVWEERGDLECESLDHEVPTWTPMLGATVYYIYRASSNLSSVAGLTPVGVSPYGSYTDTLPAYGDYYYVVVAGNPWGNSTLSNCLFISAADPHPFPFTEALIVLSVIAVCALLGYAVIRLRRRHRQAAENELFERRFFR